MWAIGVILLKAKKEGFCYQEAFHEDKKNRHAHRMI
jgi:hypothetical protein